MPIVVVIAVLVVLFGMIVCTQRVDDYWRTRSKRIKTLPHDIPPFIWSPTQCRSCGKDGELLNLDLRCWVCHGVVHGG